MIKLLVGLPRYGGFQHLITVRTIIIILKA
jgi:hypothetical protein